MQFFYTYLSAKQYISGFKLYRLKQAYPMERIKSTRLIGFIKKTMLHKFEISIDQRFVICREVFTRPLQGNYFRPVYFYYWQNIYYVWKACQDMNGYESGKNENRIKQDDVDDLLSSMGL